ncbi:MAG: hypothetical protein WCN92_05480 [Eubacteriales bacterium]
MTLTRASTSPLDMYTDPWNLKRIKTSDFGTLFELNYIIRLKKPDNEKIVH